MFGSGEPHVAGSLGRQAPDVFDTAAAGTPIGAGATRIGLVEDTIGYAWLYGFVASGNPGSVQVLQGSAFGTFEFSSVFATVVDPVSGLNVVSWLVGVVGLFARIDFVNAGGVTTLSLVAAGRGVL